MSDEVLEPNVEQVPQRRGGLGQGGFDLADQLARIAQSLSPTQRGRLFTEALIAADLVRDPDAVRRAYEQHPRAMEAYFDQIDIRALARQLGPAAREELRTELGPILVGFGAGALVSTLIQKFGN